MTPEGCREGPDDTGREAEAGDPFVAISQLGWSSRWWALAHSSSRHHPYEMHRNGANLHPHPQHRVPPPATAIWNKALAGTAAEDRERVAGEMILFNLCCKHQESTCKLGLQQQHL